MYVAVYGHIFMLFVNLTDSVSCSIYIWQFCSRVIIFLCEYDFFYVFLSWAILLECMCHFHIPSSFSLSISSCNMCLLVLIWLSKTISRCMNSLSEDKCTISFLTCLFFNIMSKNVICCLLCESYIVGLCNSFQVEV